MIDAAVAAAEARDYKALGAMLADDYEDAAGRNPRSATLYLRALFSRYPGVVVARRGLDIELLSPVLARAEVDLVVVARRRGAPLPVAVDAESFRLRVALRREGDAWRVTRADPEPRLAD